MVEGRDLGMNSKTAISNWKDALLKYAVPGIVFLVALRQIYLCETDGLLRWKGGGFGMYVKNELLTHIVFSTRE